MNFIPKAIKDKPLLTALIGLIGGAISAYYKTQYPENIIFNLSFGLFIGIGAIGLVAWMKKEKLSRE